MGAVGGQGDSAKTIREWGQLLFPIPWRREALARIPTQHELFRIGESRENLKAVALVGKTWEISYRSLLTFFGTDEEGSGITTWLMKPSPTLYLLAVIGKPPPVLHLDVEDLWEIRLEAMAVADALLLKKKEKRNRRK